MGTKMILIRQGWVRALLVLVATSFAVADARADEAAEAFVADFADKAVKDVIEPDYSNEERSRRIRLLLRENVEIRTVARFVLGRYWRRTDEATRKAFIAAFEKSIAYNLLALLKAYTGESLVVEGSQRQPKNESIEIVASRLLRPQGESFTVDWRLKKVDDGYRIIDVATAGVSMAITLRAEYESFLKRQGDVADLAAALESRLAAEVVQGQPETD